MNDNEILTDILSKGAILQRDMQTYTIIPRTPAGIISTELLRKIADAADKFNVPLVKIVSGQRIALVGVQKDDIDKIREYLDTDAAKAIGLCFHYVQACPGNDWCKFGVQDSIALAVELEEKYYGVEFPGKVKFGVSGCPICCAESNVRDIGIVGKKSGWTLVLGGNSGSNARIGDTVARQLSKEKLFELIDRFIEYYKKNANQKERTSKFIKRVGIDAVKANMGIE